MMRVQWLVFLFLFSKTGASLPSDGSSLLSHRIPHRQLQWEAFNKLIYNAVLNFPDSEVGASGLTLKVKNFQCTNVRVSDITLDAATPNMNQVVASTTVLGLDMTCTARYEFKGFLIVNGSGDLYIESFQNKALLKTVFESLDFAKYPPHDSWIASCEPTININKMDFSNGGFWGWTLDQLENLFRGRFEDMAENRLCDEMESMSNENLDTLLNDMQNYLVQYPENIVIDPLASETTLSQRQVAAEAALVPVAQLLNWKAPESYPFGFFMDDAWDETVAFLTKQVTLSSGQQGLNANLLLQENVLENGVLVMDIEDPTDQVIYEGHDKWTQTTMRVKQVKIRGLDTLTKLDPMKTIGKYTLQSKLTWQNLWLEMDLTIDIVPSTKQDSYITGGNANVGINERVTVQFALKQVDAGLSVLLALNQEELEALQVGHFLKKDNILPCFLSSIHQVEVSALSVEAIDLQPPQITGFVSEGLDKVVTNTVDAAFLMYESSMLKSSKAFFQKAVREVVNESLQMQRQSYGVEACTLLNLPAPHGIIDVRDLLLEPEVSALSGGLGQERYGDLFYGFVMPTLQKEVLTDDNINQRFLRPFTLDQSGQEGTIVASSSDSPWINFVRDDPNGTSWVALLGWEQFQFQALDAKIHNVDTVASPLDILTPINSKLIANTIRTGDETPDRPLKMAMRVMATGESRDIGVPNMFNELELSLTIPSTQIAFDALVAMNESSLLHFPLKDLDNEFCWLAALTPGANHPALNLEAIVTTMSSFTFDVACVACSSPGGKVLPDILQTMKHVGLTTSFQPYLEELLAEVAQSVWRNLNFPAMVQDAPRLCPHYPEYEAAAVASDSYGAPNSFAAPPQWSRQSVESITAIGFLSAYSSLFIMAKNYLLQPHLDAQPQIGVVVPPEAVNQSATQREPPQEVSLLDWTDLSNTLGPWAGDILDEARQVLKDAVTNDSSRRLNIFAKSDPSTAEGKSRLLQADSFIRDYLLDEDGSMNLSFDDFRFDFAGISFGLLQARIFGIDSITTLDPFVVTGPQMLQNHVELEELGVTLDLEIENGQERHNMTLALSFQNVAVDLPLLLAMDLDKLGLIELGSVLKISKILPCLLEGAHEVNIPELNVTIGTMRRPIVSGYLSPGLMSEVTKINDALFDTYGDYLAEALPGIFDTSIRRTLNARLDQYVRKVDPSQCSVMAGGGVVDFRDLFLPKNKSEYLGGSGRQQYGDLFQTLHVVMKEELTSNDGKPPAFNEVLASWTAEQSNASGVLHIIGNLLNTSVSMALGGLNATLGVELGDIYLENVDTLGPPLALLDPLDAFSLNNTASLGVGPDPLKLSARLMISVSDNKEMQVRNEVDLSVDLYEASAAATVLLRIAEDAFLKFPLKDVTNSYCWLATIIPSNDQVLGIALLDHALRLQRMDLNVTCVSCTSPQFGELISDLYEPTDGEDATDTVLQTLSQLLDGNAIQDFLDQVISESSSKCPHANDYDPDALVSASEYLKNQATPFGFTDFTVRDDRSSYFNIASGVFAGCLLLFFVIGKILVRRRNKKWKESLTYEGMFLLRRQKAKEKEQAEIIDLYATSLFRSPHIPRNIRWLVPAVIVANIVLYMGGHLGVLSTVDLEVHLAGEDFTVHNFLVFSFLDSTAKTYQNGGMEMSIMLWIFTGVWPYIKLLSSLFLWFVSPRMLSVNSRGKLLLWIDTLTKLSVVDIFTMILFLAVLLVYIGGPEEALNAEGALYSMRVIVIPGASCYCIVIAQRMSRVSSRFFLDYHDQDVTAAREACARGDIMDVYQKKAEGEEEASKPSEAKQIQQNEVQQGEVGVQSFSTACDTIGSEEQRDELGNDAKVIPRSLGGEEDKAGGGEGSFADKGDHKPAPEVHDLNSILVSDCGDNTASSVSEDEVPGSCLLRLRFLGAHLGVAFGGLTVLVLAIIGCIYAPSVSVEISDLWGLALEADTTFEEAATEYGVFSIVSAILLKSRFVLDTTWDFVALGFLLVVAFISVGMVFFIACYRFLKRLIKEGWSAMQPSQGRTAFELPSYLSLHAYKHIEIYVVAVVIGCWQLGSVSIYAIHLYCSILDAVYRVLTYIGLAETSSAQCFEAQMALPDNLLIFFGALIILLANFCIQSTKQYRKNVNEACDLLRHEDHNAEHLSSLWNTSSKKGFWNSSRHIALNRTATFSDDLSTGDASPSSYATARSSSQFIFVDQPPLQDDLSSISGLPASKIDHEHSTGPDVLFGTFSGSPSSRGSHQVIASVDQYSTPQ